MNLRHFRPIHPLLGARFARIASVGLLATALTAAPRPAVADEMSLHLDPAHTDVSFDVGATGHDVHGQLELRGGELRFDPATGAVSGTIEIDARSADTGNGSRDRTMHGEVLESESFPLFVFRPKRFAGDLAGSGASDIELRGDLEIHGAHHPLTLKTHVEIDGGRMSAHATFPVPYAEWGMKRPGFAFLRVAPVVEVTVEARGTVEPAPARAAGRSADGR